MNNRISIILLALTPTITQADTLLLIDLSVDEQLTITATTGNSAITLSGSNLQGIYLQGIIGSEFASSGSGSSILNSTLTAAANQLGTAPRLHAPGPADYGLNINALSSDQTLEFTQSQQAFTGSATWDIPSLYEDFAGGATTGNIYFPASNSTSLDDAAILGTYRVIPSPSTLTPLAALLLTPRRRR